MTSPDDAARNEKALRQANRMRLQLRESQERVRELERRLEALEASTTVQFGRLVAGAARNPSRRGARLPRDLYRLWRQRHAPRPVKGRAADADAEPERIVRAEHHLLVAAVHQGPVVAGVLAPATAGALRALVPELKIVPLYPHDALTVLPTADVDAVVVDARAGDPGGPWAYLGVPGMYDRDRALHALREVARERGLPLVLHGDAAPPTLAALDWDATDLTAALPDRRAAAR